jgi:hypothetical protein
MGAGARGPGTARVSRYPDPRQLAHAQARRAPRRAADACREPAPNWIRGGSHGDRRRPRRGRDWCYGRGASRSTRGALSRDGGAARRAQLEQELAAAKARIATLEEENRAMAFRLADIAALASGSKEAGADIGTGLGTHIEGQAAQSPRVGANAKPGTRLRIEIRGGLHPAAQKLLTALAQHAPARFTWGQAATLAGLKPSGHFNAGRKELRDAGYVAETDGLVTPTVEGLNAAGEVPAAPSTPAERLALWCDRLPALAPEMLRTLAARGERYMDAEEWRRPSAKSRPAGTGIPDRDIAQQRADRNRSGRRNTGKQALSGGHAFSELALTASRIESSGRLTQARSFPAQLASHEDEKGRRGCTDRRPHFLDLHRRSRLYRAPIIIPNRVPVSQLSKTDRFACANTSESTLR